MAVQKFEDLLVWQKSQDLAVAIYKVFNENKDFSRFLYFSLASNSEVRSMLYLSIRLNFMNNEEAEILIDKTNEISKMLHGLLKSIKT